MPLLRPARRIALLAILLGGSPALATGGIGCTVAGYPGLDIGLVVGRGVARGIVQVTISDGGEEIATGAGEAPAVLAQSWLDDDELKLDILDANAERYLARLDTRRRGRAYVGTLAYRGRTWRVRCAEDG